MSPGFRVAAFLIPVFAASAVGTAFLPPFFAARGLDPAAIGLLLGITTLVRMIAVPLWGALADRTGRTEAVLLAGATLAAAFSAAFLPATGFAAILLVAGLQAASAAALMPLADAISLTLAAAGRMEYGRVRAAGSAAYTAATAGAGLAVAGFGAAVAPVLTAIGFAFAALAARLLPRAERPRRRLGLADMGRVLRQRPVALAIAASACIQGSHGALYALSTLHWQAHGIGSVAIGLLWSEALVAETLFFLLGRRLADRLGPAGLTATAALCCIVRWTATGLSTALPVLGIVQLLHGATFGMQHWSAMRTLAANVAPERAATAQTLHAALGGALPVALATWLAGHLYDGEGRAFLAMAAIAAGGLVIAAAAARRSPQAPRQ